MAKQKIISHRDVIQKTNFTRSVTPALLKPHMNEMSLEMIITDKYSADFHDCLIASVAQYNDNLIKTRNPEVSYVQGDIVKDEGVLYIAIKDVSGVEDITCNAAFERAPVFNDDCLNDVYRYLCTWLCWEVAYIALPFTRTHVKGTGIDFQKDNGRGREAADQAMYNSLVAGYNIKRSKFKRTLDKKLQMSYEKHECECIRKAIGGDLCSTKTDAPQKNYGIHYRR